MDHKKTKSILSTLREIAEKFLTKGNAYYKRKEEIKNDSYLNADGKRIQLEKLAESFKKEAEAVYNEVKENLDLLLQIEKEAATQFDINDTAFQNSLNLINGLNGKITPELQADIIKSFTGNNQALIMLKAVFERYDLPVFELAKSIINIDKVEATVNQLDTSFYFMSRDFENSPHHIPGAISQLNHLTILLHLEEEDPEVEPAPIDGETLAAGVDSPFVSRGSKLLNQAEQEEPGTVAEETE